MAEYDRQLNTIQTETDSVKLPFSELKSYKSFGKTSL